MQYKNKIHLKVSTWSALETSRDGSRGFLGKTYLETSLPGCIAKSIQSPQAKFRCTSVSPEFLRGEGERDTDLVSANHCNIGSVLV